MDAGGLSQSGLSLDNMCRDVSTSLVRAFGVERRATRSSTTSGATGTDGKLKLTLRPSTGAKFTFPTTGTCRIRGPQFVAPPKATIRRLILSQTVKGKRTSKTLLIRVT
jgi:hypothetical protein